MHELETRQRRRRAPYIIAATLALVLAAAGLGGWALLARGEEKPAKLTLSGRLLLPAGVVPTNESCESPNYDDIHTGTQVTVTDESGRVIALGALGAGLAEQIDRGQFTGTMCTFRFVIADVPVARYYAVEVAHRGQVRFTRAQIDRGEVEITLGLG